MCVLPLQRRAFVNALVHVRYAQMRTLQARKWRHDHTDQHITVEVMSCPRSFIRYRYVCSVVWGSYPARRWTNQITLMQNKPISLLSAREKMPFEVSPFMLHLTRTETAAAKSTLANK